MLTQCAEHKGLTVVLPLHKQGREMVMRVEVRQKDRIVEYETVRSRECVEEAAARLYRRMKKDRVID